MAYNRKNLLTLMVDIQNLTLEQTGKGVTQEYVYKAIIYPTYRISRRTYYNYLREPAKSDLKKLQHNQQMQLTIF